MCVSSGHFLFLFAGKVVDIIANSQHCWSKSQRRFFTPLHRDQPRAWLGQVTAVALLCCPLVSPLKHRPQPKVAASGCDLHCLPHFHKDEHEQFLPVASADTDTTERLKYSFVTVFYDGL